MNRNFFKCFITLFIFIICSLIIVNTSSKIKFASAFKGFGGSMEVSLNNDCYTELKKSIDDKYTKQFVEILNSASSTFKDKLTEVLGDKYILLRAEYDSMSSMIASEVREFNKDPEYVKEKQKLAELKAKLDNADENAKEEYLEEFKKVLSNVTLINTKLNNRLKKYRDRISEIKAETIKLFIQNKTKLLTIRSDEMNAMREKLKDLLFNYKKEIEELNATFSVDLKVCEFPFDVSTLNDCLIAGKLETECYNDILSSGADSTVIFSENDNKFKS